MRSLQEKIEHIVKQTYPDYQGIVELVANHNLKYGDYASSVAWAVAKQQNKSPHKIAESLLEKLTDYFGEQVFVSVSPGVPFINFTLSSNEWGAQIDEERYFESSSAAGRRINFEFISANPTGPPTLANARGGVPW